jgi:hypothetical protein
VRVGDDLYVVGFYPDAVRLGYVVTVSPVEHPQFNMPCVLTAAISADPPDSKDVPDTLAEDVFRVHLVRLIRHPLYFWRYLREPDSIAHSDHVTTPVAAE